MIRPSHDDLSVGRIRSLLAVCDRGSASEAASDLGMTQAAVSKHIMQLEDQLGLPLLRRNSDGVKLTSGAVALLPSLRKFLAANEQVLDQLDSVGLGTEQIARTVSKSPAGHHRSGQ